MTNSKRTIIEKHEDGEVAAFWVVTWGEEHVDWTDRPKPKVTFLQRKRDRIEDMLDDLNERRWEVCDRIRGAWLVLRGKARWYD